ncbi:hypothetical protein [Aeromonas allosaccharophila]|uniref:hypothetical protein n=1 Tax=Aeromonas allosaccharophila TaxID=656 RepID=UPI001E54EE5F|nr:hypothetical protein [Aeromonas allosaccharophila]
MTEHIDLLPISTDDEQDAGNRYLYYTEGDLARILANLEQLRHAVFPAAIGESETGAAVPHNFPSVCLVGLGCVLKMLVFCPLIVPVSNEGRKPA